MFWLRAYTLATALAWPFALAYLYWRGRGEPAYRAHWRERLGYTGTLPGDSIWVHAASVGEVVLVAPLVAALREKYPRAAVLMTTTTPAGRERALALFAHGVDHRYLPLDTRAATRRFLAGARPRLAVIAETELWPHLIAAAAGRGVPVVIVNARVSARSAARYARWPLAAVVRPTLGLVAAIGAADEQQAARFRRLGALSARMRVTGNLKYEAVGQAHAAAAGDRLRAQWSAGDRPIWVAASTHAGEEARLLAAFARLRGDHPGVLWVVAPRHRPRFDAVHRRLAAGGWQVVRRGAGERVTRATDIVVADTVGEVSLLYAAADVVFVGGSLVTGVGGHNVLEAAALARAVCVGPYIDAWRDSVEALVACGGARICDGPDDLAGQIRAWLDDRGAAAAAGRAGARLVARNRGALARNLRLIESIYAAPG